MIFTGLKKSLFHTSFIVLLCTTTVRADTTTTQPITIQDYNAHALISNSVFFSALGLAAVVKGILDYYDIPVMWQDSLVMTLRNKMPEEDLKKFQLGHKIKTYTELVGGAFAFVLGLAGFALAAASMPQPAETATIL